MTAPLVDLCTPWATTAELCSPCLESIDDYDPALVDDALYAASNILYNLTKQRWPGWCQDTVRPCAEHASPDTIRHYPTRRLLSGTWDRGAWAAGAGLFCSCAGADRGQVGCFHVSQVELGESPLTGIVSVTIDGDVIDPARYRIDDYRWLVFQPDPTGTDTRAGWPCCQDFNVPAGDDGSFVVVYNVGTPPDRGGVRMAGVFACELILAWTGSDKCRIGRKVRSLSRQQVTMQMNDPASLLDRGLTGIEEVDQWVQAMNRGLRERSAAVVVPERRRQAARRTTG